MATTDSRRPPFAIDPVRLEFSGRLVVTPGALARIVAGLEAGGPASRPAAANLLGRLEIVGTDPTAAQLLDRLRRLAVP
jgi:hypothetical protein